MKRSFIFGLVAAGVTLNVVAQVFRPVDPTKQADVGTKTVTLPNVNFQTLPQGSRSFSILALPNTQPQSSDVQNKSVDINTVGWPTITTPTLSRTNLVYPDVAGTEKTREIKDLPTAVAPITNRQIRAFTPAGEEELKKQLNEPH
ncbi:MAG TPA: hypothetical protein VLZ12_01745 [Verrucomicrobiae bacterium]|nr:hypothetical protein [Verrucomicrobiae bacterium]